MKEILVTGGAGFVGSHLCDRLLKDGYKVTSLDNYSTGSENNHVAGVMYLSGDTVDIKRLATGSYDTIFHLGEYSRVEQSFDDISTVYYSNTVGTFEVLKFCLEMNAKLVYAGSSTKFGDNGSTRCDSPYAWTKASNTELVTNFANWYGLKHAITYFYNVYGAREICQGKYATLIGLFKEKMINGLPLSVVSPGKQRRNFTHVNDIVSGLALVGKHGAGDGYGIGSAIDYSILDVAELFGGSIEMLPERRGNRMTAELVVDKTSDLGWVERESLVKYIVEFKNSLQDVT